MKILYAPYVFEKIFAHMNAMTKLSLMFILGLVIGFLSWGEGRNPTFAIFIPFIWTLVFQTRLNAMLILGYYFSAIRSVAYAAFGYYFESQYYVAIGIVLWLCMSIMIAIPWMLTSLLFAKYKLQTPIHRVMAFVVAMILTMIPPFGIIGVANPLLALGWFMPGWGWWAFVVCFMSMTLFLQVRYQAQLIVLLIIPALWLLPHQDESHVRYKDIESVSTTWGRPNTMDDIIDRLFMIHDYAKVAAKKGIRTVIYPEGILADWKDAYQFTWRTEIESVAKKFNVNIAVGIDEEIGVKRYENAIKMSSSSGVIARARQNIPANMQLPFTKTGFNSDWTRSTQINIGGHQAMIVFCYEEHLLGLLLMGMVDRKPDVMISVLNSWWAKDEEITRVVQRTHAESFARLFGIPLIRAENQ